MDYTDGIPCSHIGCANHLTHPCEGCGRIGCITITDGIPKTYHNKIRESIQSSLEVNMPDTLAPKNDQDLYTKPDLSLVPWLILSKKYIIDRESVMSLQFEIHQWMNGKSELTIKDLLEIGLKAIDVKHLAVALGYGCVKYKRDSWKIGFGGDYDRMIKACMRHCHAYLCGEEFDGEAVDGYPNGLSHLGGILFNLMTAEREAVKELDR